MPEPSPTLTFLGAAGTVTGSRFLVEAQGTRLLVDAGLYQGLKALRVRNWQAFPAAARDLGAVVLSHAHLDHCGYLPRLVADGFAGPVLVTPGTAELASIVLRDSAHLQEEDARHANEYGYSRHHPALPLYDSADVEKTLPLFERVALDRTTEPVPGCRVTLRTAGHILGSSTVQVDVAGRRVLFSGDLGRSSHPLLRPPAPPPEADVVVVESTYGDREHPAPDPDLLADAVVRTVRRGGTVLVPAFAVDRTELVLLELHRLTRSGRIPRLPVYVDSPMALATLDVYRRAMREGWPELRRGVRALDDAFAGLDVHPVRDAMDSARLNRPRVPCVVISASGMGTGGRVVHHLAHQLPDRRNCVVLTGFQAAGTRGRSLLEGARTVRMYGRDVPVRAEVVAVTDFSVHADTTELVAWLAGSPRPPERVCVVHGEPQASAALARRIREELGWDAHVPGYGERVSLG